MLSNRRRAVVSAALLSGTLLATALPARESRQAPEVVLRAGYLDAGTRIEVPDGVRLKTLPPTAVINVTYVGFPPDARLAFQHAVDVWSRLISSPVPIEIEARWLRLPTGVLGLAGANYIHRDFMGAEMAGTWYVDALADRLAGVDLSPGSPDVTAVFNSSFGNWYLGTDGNPPSGTFDFVTVVLHEIGHGLGMTGSLGVDDGTGLGEWGSGGFPLIYDRFAVDGQGTSLIDEGVFPNPSAALRDALQSGAVFFDAPLANLKNGDTPAELFAPSIFLGGSSFSHFDEAAFPPGHPASLMTPFLNLNEVIHDPGELTLCLLDDLGWATSANCVAAPPECVPSDTVMCLNDDRFQVELEWVRPTGERNAARVKTLDSDDSGLFFFANPNNLEMLVKVLDNCAGPTNRFWVFAAATTTLELTLRVVDTQTGVEQVYRNPPDTPAAPITDTRAFATCP